MHSEYSWSLVLPDGVSTVSCPICKSTVTPINAGFANCFFKVSYTKTSDDPTEVVQSGWKKAGNAYHTWERKPGEPLEQYYHLEFFVKLFIDCWSDIHCRHDHDKQEDNIIMMRNDIWVFHRRKRLTFDTERSRNPPH